MLDHDSAKEYAGLPYRMEVSFDAESGVWIIRYPELPGCTAHGDSPEDAIALGNEAKALWIETALEENQPVPRPLGEPEYSGKLVLRLPKTLHEAAVRTAEREGVSLNAYLIQLVAEGIQRSGLKSLLSLAQGAKTEERSLSPRRPRRLSTSNGGRSSKG
jgi:predicted RNase H-like HicB family nuclease